MTLGGCAVHALYAAAPLRIADLLAHGPRDCGELDAETGAVPEALYRVLLALVGVGVFFEILDGRFRLRPMADARHRRRKRPQAMSGRDRRARPGRAAPGFEARLRDAERHREVMIADFGLAAVAGQCGAGRQAELRAGVHAGHVGFELRAAVRGETSTRFTAV